MRSPEARSRPPGSQTGRQTSAPVGGPTTLKELSFGGDA